MSCFHAYMFWNVKSDRGFEGHTALANFRPCPVFAESQHNPKRPFLQIWDMGWKDFTFTQSR